MARPGTHRHSDKARHLQSHSGLHLTRREVLAAVAAALTAAVLKGEPLTAAFLKGRSAVAQPALRTPDGAASPEPASAVAAPEPVAVAAHPVAVNQPGSPEVILSGAPSSGAFALTFDDGTCPSCAAQIVAGAQRSGFHLTLSPNGYLGPTVWDAHAEAIAAMAATGQVALCNHTWDHKDLTTLSATRIKDELVRNEAWMQDRFGVSSRPFYRPPYGSHNPRVDDIAGQLGWTKVILWNATFGDSIVHPPQFILQQLRESLKPGTIMLGHANHPATASVIDQIVAIVQQSGLRPLTLLELLGTDPNPDIALPDRPNLVRRAPAPIQRRPSITLPSASSPTTAPSAKPTTAPSAKPTTAPSLKPTTAPK